MIKLLEDEIIRNFPFTDHMAYPLERKFNLHCSDQVYKALRNNINEILCSIPINEEILTQKEMEEKGEMRFTSFYSPSIGTMNIIIDMEQGYKLELL